MEGDVIFLTSHLDDGEMICTHQHALHVIYYIGYHLCDFRCHIQFSNLAKINSYPIMAAPLTSKPLVSDFSSSVSHIPSTYVRPISDRPKLSQAETSGDTIPLIDLRDLHGPNRAEIMRQIAHACSTHGFFQVTPVQQCFFFKFTRINFSALSQNTMRRCSFFFCWSKFIILSYVQRRGVDYIRFQGVNSKRFWISYSFI